MPFDPDRYFARIGYRGARVPTLDVLTELHRLHPHAIPFENLDPLAGRRVVLTLPAIAEKLVESRRGGYCFEHNTLFAHVLMQLGFRVTPLIARVLWGRGPDAVTARSHMLLRVDLDDGPWIADVGFGGVTLTAPLRLAAGGVQQTPLEACRLTEAADGAFDFEIQAPRQEISQETSQEASEETSQDTAQSAADSNWIKVYRFDLRPAEWIDYEVANWYTSTWPESIFTHNLMVCRVMPHGRATLFNDRLTERASDGRGTDHAIGSAAELGECLHERFGLDIAGMDLDALYARVQGRGMNV
ncbi:N-hydroxyarylamine O-acetyltransferase [Paraburkholderia kururiensis]|uniref:arylamine N-acetyltransferase family protein n=1 Tax=Paraburkholderia kururiensis TaxID=984307 RepID=UPI0039A4C5B7